MYFHNFYQFSPFLINFFHFHQFSPFFINFLHLWKYSKTRKEHLLLSELKFSTNGRTDLKFWSYSITRAGKNMRSVADLGEPRGPGPFGKTLYKIKSVILLKRTQECEKSVSVSRFMSLSSRRSGGGKLTWLWLYI